MFGMGFMEIFFVMIVAVIALGPEKLPTAAVDMAKMFKKLKGGIDDAKSTLDSELNMAGLKDEAERIKSSVNINRLASLELDDIMNDDKPKKKKEKVDKA
ncbi:MAG TPA: twin-arginine translocase subunit TatB [Arcobacter sp.]|nr:twin-arginine translocase subunit TatB [Arcobacter sp.]HIP55610.1 twin-arginine translocase subunit TatB [Arcobacter sp.]